MSPYPFRKLLEQLRTNNSWDYDKAKCAIKCTLARRKSIICFCKSQKYNVSTALTNINFISTRIVNIRLNYWISITKIIIFLGFALSLKGMESTKISSEDTLSSPDHSRNSGNNWPNWNKERDSDESWPRWNK